MVFVESTNLNPYAKRSDRTGNAKIALVSLSNMMDYANINLLTV